MSEIKRPDWDDFFYLVDYPTGKLRCSKWFDENIKGRHFYDPKDAVVVFCDDNPELVLHEHEIQIWKHFDGPNTTHKALLINIEPIKQETCADVLRDLIKDCDGEGIKSLEGFYERAKAALEREK